MRIETISAKEFRNRYKQTKKSKYKNTKIETKDGKFDSKLEWKRFNTLELLQKNKSISKLKRQVKINLSSAMDLKCFYIADFVYLDSFGELIIEDTKGFETKEFKVKMKWLLSKYCNFTFNIVKDNDCKSFNGVGNIDLKKSLEKNFIERRQNETRN